MVNELGSKPAVLDTLSLVGGRTLCQHDGGKGREMNMYDCASKNVQSFGLKVVQRCVITFTSGGTFAGPVRCALSCVSHC